MAEDDKKEVPVVCVFTGEHDASPTRSVDAAPSPPTVGFARELALKILGGRVGSMRTKKHCRERMSERNFDVFDMEYAIRNGSCVQGGEYLAKHLNFKYTFRANIDGADFDAVFALSSEHDLFESPVMILITGVWKTRNGRRRKTF